MFFFFGFFVLQSCGVFFFESTYYLNRMKFVKMTKDSDTKNSKLKKKTQTTVFFWIWR